VHSIIVCERKGKLGGDLREGGNMARVAVLPLLDVSKVEPEEPVNLEKGDFALISPFVEGFRVYAKVGALYIPVESGQ